MISVVLVAWALAQSGPQETVIAEPEKLIEELRNKVQRLESFSGTVSMSAIDVKGTRTPRFKGQFHVDLGKRWLYFTFEDLASGEVTHLVMDGDRPSLNWDPRKAKGTRVHSVESLREGWKHQWYFSREREKLLPDKKVPSKTLEDFIATLRPDFSIQLDPTKPGDKDPATFRWGLGKSTSGGVSWLKGFDSASTYSCTKTDVIIRETELSKTTVIDRDTGVLKSIRLDLKSGEARVLEMTNSAVNGRRPDLKLPEAWTDRPDMTPEAHQVILGFFRSALVYVPDDLIKAWPSVGGEDKAELVRNFYAWIGAEWNALNRESARMQWVGKIVKKLADDDKLDEFERDFDAQVQLVRDAVETQEEKNEGALVERLARFRLELEKNVEASAASKEVQELLIRRIREGFETERLRKAVTSRPKPNYARYLREAIAEARESKEK